MTPKMQGKLPSKGIVLSFILVLIGLNFLLTMYSSHWLRPAADDYCLAWMTAREGIVGATIGSWNTINGYLASIFFASLWVGWPLAYLPFSLASAVPFIVASLSLGLIISCFTSMLFNFGVLRTFFVAMIFSFLWWVFLWAPEAYDGLIFSTNSFQMREILSLAYGLTHWQTLNGIYVLQLTTILLGLWLTINFLPKTKYFRYLMFIFLGLFSGATGPTLSSSIIVFTTLLLLYYWVNKIKYVDIDYSELLLFVFAALVGLIGTQFFSPGNYQRQAMLASSFVLTPLNFLDLLDISFRFAVRLWFSAYLGLGSILIFILSFALSYFAYSVKSEDRIKVVRDFGFLFGLFALLQIFINRAAEFFAYRGYWHFVSPIACIFISICLLGVWSGCAFAKYDRYKIYSIFIKSLILLSILMSTSANIHMVKSMYERQSRWSGGSAESLGVSDIEVDWIRGCWKELNKLRPYQYER